MAKRKEPIVIRRYKNEKAFTKDATKFAERGYKVLEIKREKKFLNPGTALLGGFLFGRQVQITVTYQLSE